MKSTSKKSDSKTPLAALHHLQFVLQHKADRLLRAGLGVGFGQVRILEGLSQTSARSQRELASQLFQTEANISRQLKLLDKKGLVSIVIHPKSKRQRQVRLTANGAKMVSQAQKIMTDLHKEILAKIDYRDAFNFTETADKILAKL